VSARSAHLPRAAILTLLAAAGPMSRADLSHRLGLSPATVTQLTRELLARARLRELEHAPSSGGRPARLLGLAGPVRRALGVKITRDHLAIADVSPDGTVRAQRVHEFDARASGSLNRLSSLLKQAVAEAEGGPDALLGVGVAVPGGVNDPADGVVHADILEWRGIPLGRRLRTALDLPVLMDNDVNTLAVGERLHGRGRDHRDLLLVTLGAGVGAAVIAQGTVHRGAHGDAGEFGHFPVAPDGPRCVCGNRGCLEAVVGDRALVEKARGQGVLAETEGIGELQAAADAGSEGARTLYREAGEVLGRAVGGLIAIVDPEAVVLLGEGVAAWRHISPGFEPALQASLPPFREKVPVQIGSWDDRTWIQGAAALVLAAPFDTAGFAGSEGHRVRSRVLADTGPAEPAADGSG
jgi:predicted NBD/HSP70 family sugar kinase